MSTLHLYSDAQRCQKTQKVMINIRCGCPCGCQPTLGAIPDADWFKGLHGDQAAQQRLFVPISRLMTQTLTASRPADIDTLVDAIRQTHH
jgi:hypothetical protein